MATRATTGTAKRHLRAVRAGEGAQTALDAADHSGEERGDTDGLSGLSARQSDGVADGERETDGEIEVRDTPPEPQVMPQQVNGHDAKVATEQANRLLRALAERGVMVDALTVRTAAESFVAINVLVNAGLISNDAVNALVSQRMVGLLANTLQAVEEQQLQQQRKPVRPVRRPEIIVPGRQ